MNTLRHIGIIMDGNRRWARERGKTVFQGHYEGVENLKRIIEHCSQKGIEYLTVYTLSTENLKSRSEKELSNLFKLIKQFTKTYIEQLKEKGIQMNIYGDLMGLPADVRKSIEEAIEYLKDGAGMTLNLAVNYGGRHEIIHAVKEYMKNGGTAEDLDKASFENYLYSKNDPDPEIVIRTGGNHRLSGFLTWQSIYSELFFVKIYWPGFTPVMLDQIIDDYYQEERRFGK